jgi:uncharacterized protein YlxW (UPF0749 family)
LHYNNRIDPLLIKGVFLYIVDMKNWFLVNIFFLKWRLILLFLLIFVSCQKDYYLDDLNDALSQVSNLQIERSTLLNRIEQLNQDKLQLENQISQLNTKLSQYQSENIKLTESSKYYLGFGRNY